MRKRINLDILLLLLIAVSAISVSIAMEIKCYWSMPGANPQRTNALPSGYVLENRYMIKSFKGIKARTIHKIPIIAEDKLFMSLSDDFQSIGSGYIAQFDIESQCETNRHRSNLNSADLQYSNDYLLASYERNLICFQAKTLTENWHRETCERILSSTVIGNSVVYIEKNAGIFCLDIETGDINWKVPIESEYSDLISSKDENVLYIRNKGNNTIEGYNINNGDYLGTIIDLDDHNMSTSHMLLCYDPGIILFSNFSSGDTECIAIDINVGEAIYTVDYFYSNGYANGTVFGVYIDSNLSNQAFGVVDAKTGSELWKDSGSIHYIDMYSAYLGMLGNLILTDNNAYYTYTNTDNNDYFQYFCIKDLKHGVLKQRLQIDMYSPYYLIPNNTDLYLFQSHSREDGHSEIIYLTPAADSVSYTINSNTYNPDNDEPREMDSEPVINNGRTLLPARYVVEPLGGQVFWDGDERKVTCKLVAPDNSDTDEYKENIVELWVDESTARVNGEEIQIDPDNPNVVPTIINDRTMVPMRFLAESLGCDVEWEAETKEIILTYGK